MSKVAEGSAKHGVPSPCGRPGECQRFSTNFCEPLRFLHLRFLGIHDSHYIGVNRIHLFSGEAEQPFKVLMADGSKESAAAAGCVAGGGGWWAASGKEHSLLLQLEDPVCVSHVGLWCANVGATPLEIEIGDAKPLFPDVCASEEPKEADLSVNQADPMVHEVAPGCGQNDDASFMR